MPVFNDETIEAIFGADEAEGESEDRFIQYFYYNQAYAAVRSNLAIRILVGHKGVGKSAVIKRAYLEDQSEGHTAVLLKAQTVSGSSEITANVANLVALVEAWKKTILYSVIEKLIFQKYSNELESALSEIRPASVMAHISLLKQVVTSQGAKEIRSFDQNRFLASDFVEFGYQWEIHPAYRWALQPQDVNDVLRSLKGNVEKYVE